MRDSWKLRIGVAALALAPTVAAVVLVCCTAGASTQGQVLCTDNPCVIQGANPGNGDGHDTLVIRSAGGLNHGFEVTDQNGAAIIYTNVDSISSGDLPFCSTSTDLSNRVCTMPGTWDPSRGQYVGPGYIKLWPSATGAPVLLGITDVRYLKALEAAHITVADLKRLVRLAGGR